MKPLDENVNLNFIRQKAIKIAITEIKAVKLCRNYNLKDLFSEKLASYVSEVFDHL